ncbi:MAG: hypothetical protein LQ341_004869, partial [Variospora aurantia]
MSDYSYTPLEDQHIRLLELRAGARGTVLHIDLIPTDLRLHPSYHALSYTWGSSTLDHEVVIDSGASPEVLHITRNLYTALQHLRYAATPRRLWIDAICINQRDTGERNRQVARMDDIYQSAEKVIIWLGPEEDGSSRAIGALDQLASKLNVDWVGHGITAALPQDTNTDWLDLGKPAPFTGDVYQSIYCLFKRSWFGRLWIWQEVLVATDAPEVSCGDSTMTWTSFAKAVLALGYRTPPPVPEDFSEVLFRIWPLCTTRHGHRLREMLYETRFAQCSDQRDRVYGILSLVEEHERLGIKPDYNKSVRDVYHDVMVRNSFSKEVRSLLSCCELRDGTQAMASWIPDWSVPRRCTDIWESRACGQSSTQARLSGDGNNVLHLVGVRATHVTRRFEILPDTWANPDLRHHRPSMWAIRGAMEKLVTAVQEAQLLPHVQQAEVICRVLFLNQFSERWEPKHERFPRFQATIKRFIELTDPEHEISDISAHDTELLDNFYSSAYGRAFIFTANTNMIGLALDTCRENDCIASLLGCESPMVLRPTADGYYTVVGECYVHGLMEGEGFLGPLPAHWERIVRYDEGTGSWYDVYVERKRGTYQVEDPRLGPLPKDWYREEHPKQHLHTSYRHRTKNIEGFTSYSRDPRMLPESLRERGVELQ